MVTIKKIETEGDELDLIRVLFRQYADELNEDLCFQSFDDELKDPLKKYGPPHGSLFIAFHNAEPAGCIAFKPIIPGDVCEMKRLYVKQAFRKHGIGDRLIEVLSEQAVLNGYNKMVLDTLVRLQPALRLYHRYGFKNISAYYSNPLPGVIYLEKVLGI